MTDRNARRITVKANKMVKREEDKRAKELIRTLKADIRRTAKKGIADFRCKIRDIESYNKAKAYFKSKGFRCWEYTFEDCKYLAIEW